MRRPSFYFNTILGVVIAATACSNDAAMPSQPGVLADLAKEGVQFSVCSPQSARRNGAWIGAEGGTLSVGPHTLVIPSGALSEDTWISGEIPAGDAAAVRFQPEGLHFDRSARLTMTASGCTGWGQFKKMVIVYTDDQFNPLEVLKSDANNASKTVSADLKHFSQYSVAY